MAHIESAPPTPQSVAFAKLGEGRRVAIPAELCQRHHLRPGDQLVLESSDQGITLRSYADVAREVQDYFQDETPRTQFLSDELIEDRRREAEQEDRD